MTNSASGVSNRRAVLGALALAAAGVKAQAPASLPPARSSSAPFARLREGGAMTDHLMPDEEAERVTDSTAPPGPPGRWTQRAPLPLPRSEMAWAAAWAGRLHVIGGYGGGRVDRTDHHVYEPAEDRWLVAAPLPRGANHVAVAADAGRVYALGGFVEQNTNPVADAYSYDVSGDRWEAISPLPRARGAAAAVVLDGRIHLIGGAAAPKQERASVGWHEVYDPKSDQWTLRKALPGARDHVGCVSHHGRLHVIGGRFNTFEYNTDLHHVYLPELDTWQLRAPLPTARSGLGLVVYRGRFFAMGGEGGVIVNGRITQARVFGQMESYDPDADTWQRHAPMPTPRHAVGAATLADAIFVAGGGAVTGGAVQSAVHESFALG
jgi:N-acetylneuraminic acid mutarotase